MLEKLKSYFESLAVTPISWLIGVSGVLMVRFFLESVSSPTASGLFASDSSTLLHYFLFYLSGLLVLLLFFRFALPSWKRVIPQLVAFCSAVLLLPPIADWIISGGKGFQMTYIFGSLGELADAILLFGADRITVGMRIEVALVLIFLALLVYYVEKSWRRGLLASLFLYIIAIVFVSMPSILALIGGNEAPDITVFFIRSIENSSSLSNNLHGSLQYSSLVRGYEVAFNFLMGKVWALLSSALACLWFGVGFKNKFLAVLHNLRIERMAHYILSILVGVFASYVLFPSLKLNWNDWLSLVSLCLSFAASFVFAICVNDLADKDIDKISNSNRPLIKGSLTEKELWQVGLVALLFSLVFGFLAGYTAFFFILAFTALYYVYSAPPTRFKLVPVFSSFLISLCYLTAMMAGFFLFFPLKQVSAFPAKLVFGVVIIITLLSQVRDLKDMKGDKSAGILTTAVILGEVWAPRVIGFFAAFSFVLVPLISGFEMLFVSAVPAGAASYYFINKRPYSERPVVWTYFFFVLATILIMVF